MAVSNDFQQYWLGAYLPIGAAVDNDAAAALPFQEVGAPFGSAAFTVNGADSAANQDNIYSFLTTSSILPAATYPQFASRQAIKIDRPPSFDPPTGTHYAFSQAADDSYKRLSRTVDLTGKTTADLSFTASYDTEPGWDYLAVEAHTVGSGRLDDAPRRERPHDERHHGQQQLPADPDRRGAPVHGPLRDAAPREQSRGGRRDV